MATPLEDVVASVHSPGHAGFIILMPQAGLSMQCSAALMLGGKALLAPLHEARRVEPDSMAWGLHGHSDTGPGIIGGGWPFVKYQPYILRRVCIHLSMFGHSPCWGELRGWGLHMQAVGCSKAVLWRTETTTMREACSTLPTHPFK